MPRRLRFPFLLVTALAAAAVGITACNDGDPTESTPTPSPSPSPTPTATGTPIPLAFPGEFTGSIAEPGERHRYSFIAQAGESVVLDVDAQALASGNGSSLDGRLAFYDPQGSLLRIVDDGTTFGASTVMKDPYVVFTAQVAGTYVVTIEDRFGGGGPSGYDYRLVATRPEPADRPGGTNCGAAVLLTNLQGSYSSEVTSSTNTVGGTAMPLQCVGSVVPAQDHLYKAVLAAGEKYQIVRSGSSWDGALYVTTECATTLATADSSCIAGADGSEDSDGVVFSPAVTGTHYIYVDGVVDGAFGPYQLDVRTFAPGD